MPDEKGPDEYFANLRYALQQGLSEGKPFCVAWGDFYDHQSRCFADFYAAAAFLLELRQQFTPTEHEAFGLFSASDIVITAHSVESGEIPF